MSTDEQLLSEIEVLTEQILRLCAGQRPAAVEPDTARGRRLNELRAALDEARRCVCQEKLAKWEARRNG